MFGRNYKIRWYQVQNMNKQKCSNAVISTLQFGYWVSVSSSSWEYIRGRLNMDFASKEDVAIQFMLLTVPALIFIMAQYASSIFRSRGMWVDVNYLLWSSNAVFICYIPVCSVSWSPVLLAHAPCHIQLFSHPASCLLLWSLKQWHLANSPAIAFIDTARTTYSGLSG